MDPVISLLGIYPKECKTEYSRDTCTPMFIPALFTIAKLWKHPRCPTADKMWYIYTTKKMWSLCTMKYYPSIKKNDMMSLAGKWMELENIKLSKVSQAQKDKGGTFSLICGR
jgi:hypothetical protein